MSQPYEYLPPHMGKPAPKKAPAKKDLGTLSDWEVSIPWAGQNVVRRVSARDKNHALRKVGMEISRSVNLNPDRVFKTIYSEKLYKVEPVRSSFMNRAANFIQVP